MGVHSPAVWIGFSALVAGLLVLDLGVLNRRSHVLSVREATLWSAGLVGLALLFGGFLWIREGATHALEYYTGYLIELSLSVDNLFVFILIFQYFAVPAELQPRVLKWGILGAIVMRAIMIGIGAVLLARFHWITYLFGAILLITGIRMFSQEEERLEIERNPVVRLARKVLPFGQAYDGQRFFTSSHRGWVATPLLLVLIVVEWSDLVFAIDSIPAIFAVTRDPFLVYSSNVFAILGLRAMFFVLAGMLDRFVYLKPAVGCILTFVGLKMVGAGWVKIPTPASLAAIVSMLAIGILASWWKGRAEAERRAA